MSLRYSREVSGLGADLVKTGLALKLFVKYFILLAFLSIACDPDEYTAPELGSEYFPLQTGFYQIYSVESKEYPQDGSPQTETFEMLVEVVDSFPSGSNEITFVVHRSKRPVSGDEWAPLDTWSVRKNDREVVVSEGNTSYLKLVFPVRDGSKWNGNKYNTIAADEYEIKGLGESFEVSEGTTFDNTLTVEQEDNEEYIIALDKRIEVYSKNSGLIYKEVIQLNYCIEEDCRGQQIVESGIEYKQWLKEYGVQ